MTDPNTNAPLSELIGGLVDDVSGLLRKEIDLAKTEASEKVSKALGGLEVAVVGLVLAIGAVGVSAATALCRLGRAGDAAAIRTARTTTCA